MIYDMTTAILSLASSYQRIIYESFEFQGVTYTEPAAVITVRGVMNPLTTEERVEFLGLGYTIEGKMNFFMPISEGRLNINDRIIDKNNVEWEVLPFTEDQSENGGFVKYRLSRKVV